MFLVRLLQEHTVDEPLASTGPGPTNNTQNDHHQGTNQNHTDKDKAKVSGLSKSNHHVVRVAPVAD